MTTGQPMAPSWSEFIQVAVHEVDEPSRASVQERIDAGDLIGAASIVRTEIPAAAWNRLIRGTFTIVRRDVHERDLELVRAIWQVSSGLVVTTNYDDSLQWGTDRSPQVFGLDAPVDLSALISGSPTAPVIWHLHGRAARPETLVLAEEGYRSLYSPDARTEERYKAGLMGLSLVFATKSVLFVGSSLNDAEVLQVLQNMAATFPETVPEHYVLCLEDEVVDITERLALKGIANVTPITFQAFGSDMLTVLRSLSSTPPENEAAAPRNDAFQLQWARRRCRTIAAGSESFIRRVSPLLTEHRPTRASEILADLAVDGGSPFERAVALLLRYEFDGRIDSMLAAASTEVSDPSERRNLDLFKAIALEKLEKTDLALEVLQRIVADERTIEDLRLCAEFNMEVCREKLGHPAHFTRFLKMGDKRTGCGELIWTKAFNMQMIYCGTRQEEFEHMNLLERAISAEIEEASTGYMKTIVNWSHLTGEAIDASTLARIEEQAKSTSITTRVAVLSYLQTAVKGETLSRTIREIIEDQLDNPAVQKLVPVMRLHGRYTLYGEYLMHDKTWGYVAPTRMYLDSSPNASGSWVPETDRAALRLSEMGLQTLGVISGDLPFGRGFASSTVLSLLHIGLQLEREQAENVSNIIDWMTHGFEPSGVDVRSVSAQAAGLYRQGVWRDAPVLDLEGVFVTVPKHDLRTLDRTQRQLGLRAERLAVIADRLTYNVERGSLDLNAFTEYCRNLVELGVYSPTQEDLIRACMAAGFPAKAIGGLYDKAVIVLGEESRLREFLATIEDAQIVGRL